MPDLIDEAQVRHIAFLARLKLTDEEVRLYQRRLGALLDDFTKLQDVNTDGVEPTAHPLSVTNIFRDDVPTAPLGVDAALANAPARESTFFRVPKVLEQESA